MDYDPLLGRPGKGEGTKGEAGIYSGFSVHAGLAAPRSAAGAAAFRLLPDDDPRRLGGGAHAARRLGYPGAVQVGAHRASSDVLKLPLLAVTATSKVWKRPPLALRRWIAIFWRERQLAGPPDTRSMPLSRRRALLLTRRLLGTRVSPRRTRDCTVGLPSSSLVAEVRWRGGVEVVVDDCALALCIRDRGVGRWSREVHEERCRQAPRRVSAATTADRDRLRRGSLPLGERQRAARRPCSRWALSRCRWRSRSRR